MKLRFVSALLTLAVALPLTLHAQSSVWQRLPGDYGANVSSIAFTSDGSLVAGSDSGLFRSTNLGLSWTEVATQIDRWPQALTAGVDGSVAVTVSDTVMYHSTDNGSTWAPSQIDRNGVWPISLATAPDGTMFMGGMSGFAGFFSGLYRSTDNGRSWHYLTGAGYNVGALMADTGGVVMIGLHGQGDVVWPELGRSSDNGDSWQIVIDAEEFGATSPPTDFAVDSTGTYWMVTSTSVYRSQDRGVSWDTVALPPGDRRQFDAHVAVTPDNTLLVAMMDYPNGALYSSTNRGATWQRDNTWPLDAHVQDLVVTADGFIYAATNTRGIQRRGAIPSTVDRPDADASAFALELGGNPVVERTPVTIHSPRTADVSLDVFNTLGVRVTTLYSGSLPAGRHVIDWNATSLDAGYYLLVLRSGADVVSRTVVVL